MAHPNRCPGAGSPSPECSPGAAGLALSQATATALRAETSPVEAVGTAVRDFTPGPLAVFLVHLVGHLDKPLLIGGTTLVRARDLRVRRLLDAPLPARAGPRLRRADRGRPAGGAPRAATPASAPPWRWWSG